MSGLHAKAKYIWEQFKLSIWLIPLSMSFGSIILAILTLQIDYQQGQLIADNYKFLRIDAQGARQVIAVISGAMMTITGVVFSISVVTLTLASNQFGPKILRNYLRDTSNKIVLGLFVSTFVYGLVVLSAIDTQHGGFIPLLSLITCIALTFISIGALIYYIHNISTAIQADHIIASIAEELVQIIDNSLTPISTDPKQHNSIPPNSIPEKERITLSHTLLSPASGYIQTIDYQGLVEQAKKYDGCVVVNVRAGQYIIEGTSLGTYHSFCHQKDIDTDKFFTHFLLGRQRTPIQDIEFSLTQLLQIALRALSPGINDSITGITCINWLGSSLGHMSQCEFSSGQFDDDKGICRIQAKTFSFKGAVNAVFNPLRQNTRENEMVSIHLLETLAQLLETAPLKDYRDTLFIQAEYIFKDCQRCFNAEIDLLEAKERFKKCQSFM